MWSLHLWSAKKKTLDFHCYFLQSIYAASISVCHTKICMMSCCATLCNFMKSDGFVPSESVFAVFERSRSLIFFMKKIYSFHTQNTTKDPLPLPFHKCTQIQHLKVSNQNCPNSTITLRSQHLHLDFRSKHTCKHLHFPTILALLGSSLPSI